jgi:5-(carboxyamino)imidazole ribonucleotide synthase
MKRIGILGGGQLGRMLLQAAANYPLIMHVLENDPECPSAHLCHSFTCGDIRDFDTVYAFGKGLDAITIEIESVNIEALEKLEQEGVFVCPSPSAIRIIQNKIHQKKCYQDNQIPTSPFIITQNRQDVAAAADFLPAVQKLGLGGYDGKGVQMINTPADLPNAFDAPSVLEKKVTIAREIACMMAVDQEGKEVLYPITDMVFDPDLHQLNYQITPAILDEKVRWKAEAITRTAVRQLKSPGIFAVELFVDPDDNVLINEMAPRVHNSGHHTIEAHYCSQFDMLIRILAGYPLGNPGMVMPSALVNIVGSDHATGLATYEGLHEVLQMEHVFVHLYGKQQVKPGRKMGHATILHADRQELIHRVNRIRHTLRVVGRD